MNEKKTSNLVREKMKIGFGSVIELILILLEIYVFTENKNNILVIGILLIAMAIVLYVIISAAINLSEHAKNAQLNRIDDLYEAQKASYIMLKKNFDALSNRLDEMEEANAIPSEEIINAQKAVAKVALSRNKENAIALMESNEMLISQLKSMENLLKEMNSSVGERQEKIFEQTKEELSRRNEELENRIRDLSNNIDSIEIPAAPITPSAYYPQSFVQPMPMPQMQPTAPVMQQEVAYSEQTKPATNASLDHAEEKVDLSEMIKTDASAGGLDEMTPEEVSEVNLDEVKPEEVSEVSLDEVNPEEDSEVSLDEVIPEEDSVISLDEVKPEEDSEVGLDEVKPEEDNEVSLDEIIPENTGNVVQEEASVNEVEENSEAASLEPEVVSEEPNINDFFSEEIQATQDAVEEVEATEPQEEVASETENIRPDLDQLKESDSNKVLTPEEIQKLFANL